MGGGSWIWFNPCPILVITSLTRPIKFLGGGRYCSGGSIKSGFMLVGLSMNAKDCSITKVLNICALVLRLAMYSLNKVGKRLKMRLNTAYFIKN